MSDFTAAPAAESQTDERPSMGREIAREATINVAANAAGVVGFVGGVVVLGKIVDWTKRRKAAKNQATETPAAPEPTES